MEGEGGKGPGTDLLREPGFSILDSFLLIVHWSELSETTPVVREARRCSIAGCQEENILVVACSPVQGRERLISVHTPLLCPMARGTRNPKLQAS